MIKFKTLVKDFIEDESGLTAVEYAIAGGLVVGTMVVAFTQLGTAATGEIKDLCSAIGGSAATYDCDGA
ncbi:Flp family type IVb pilin [Thalassotalea litorea]|uniref:Flp family type IVb pilin n=1 Tax=Thalassotalea litorea TaxID=2020715 RepID=UPI0037351737